ncbi:MAG: hypothetical protein ACRYFR_08760 [Janthinobacterium lividum]
MLIHTMELGYGLLTGPGSSDVSIALTHGHATVDCAGFVVQAGPPPSTNARVFKVDAAVGVN